MKIDKKRVLKYKFKNFKLRKENKRNLVKISLFLVFVCILFLSIGYAAFNNTFSVNSIKLTVRPEEDIRVTNVYNGNLNSTGIINTLDFNKDRVITNITLPSSDSTVTIKVKITNIGNTVMGIKSISGLPSNISYSLSGYKLKDKLCNTSGSCTNGAEIEFDITLSYNSDKISETTYDFDIIFEFARFYTVTYTNIDAYTNTLGSVVYFDVSSGSSCTVAEYNQSYDSSTGQYLNSKTGYNGINKSSTLQNGCLKFYVLNDPGASTIDLILDHNTSESIAWASSGSNTSGPTTAINQLKSDTASWTGVQTPSSYSGTYTISYSDSKARFPTATDIANATENYWFYETSNSTAFYFENDTINFTTAPTISNRKNTYGWVYDRTWSTCENNACYNNSYGSSSSYDYWTASSVYGATDTAWAVNYTGKIEAVNVSTASTAGIRPVITVTRTSVSLDKSFSVLAGETYYSKLGNYYPYTISVTMGGSSASSYTYSNGEFIISNVSGDIVISANEYVESILNGSKPLFSEANLTPVYWDGSSWRVASIYQKWYSYTDLKWANAVNLGSGVTKKVGEFISMSGFSSGIYGAYVWIPRYEYKIDGDYGLNGEDDEYPGEIEVNFISRTTTTASSNYRMHPAFIFGSSNVSGIWMGKFESSHTSNSSSTSSDNMSCSDTTCTTADGIRVVADVLSVRYNKISNFFYTSRSMSRSGNPFGFDSSTIDTHMAKNSEWGAAAYLSQSRYGKYNNSNYSGGNKEIYINNSTDCYTGRSAGRPGGSSVDYMGSGSYFYYLDVNGTGASTTGTIYGIYDMSGGSNEYSMANFKQVVMSSGFSSNLPDSKYFDEYDGTGLNAATACDGGVCYGHAYSETKGWYGDYSSNLTRLLPWAIRGGNGSGTVGGSNSNAGVFFYGAVNGSSNSLYSFRMVLTPVQ